MAVTTSQVTTSANGDLALNPNGTGGVKFTKLATAAMPVGVKADGTIQHFKISELVAGGLLTSTDTIMVQKTSETTTKKSTLAEVLAGAGGATLASFSVTTGTASNGGTLSYENTSGVFTFQPASLSDLGGLTTSSLSVTTAAASGGGSLSYDNTTGVFTFAKSLAYTGTNGIGFATGSTTALEVKIISLTTR